MVALEGALAAGTPLAVAAGALTIVATRRVLGYLTDRQILDRPNDRSSHTLPTPRGGGLATTPVMAALLILGCWGTPMALLGIGALVLLAVSWVDDRKGLPALPRFLAHAGTIAALLAMLPPESLVFGDALPFWLDRVLAGLGWLWFVNLYNFMDGIDGITGTETISLGLGIAVIGGSAAVSLAPPALVVAAVGAGFLAFNWHPAKLFLGDSGSVPFGYVLGGLLLLLAIEGQLAAALILPAYYLADATITLGRRALNRERIWQAHRKHFYQRAVQGGKRHDQVVLAIAGGNGVLIGCAVLTSQGYLWPGIVGAVAVTGGLLALLQFWAKGKPA
jgi:UDP-N-acetylmuramyl pentapeptide phosphotransferase/UDP-N-acetylglucosamine-1-phosphate transferase